VWANRRPDTTWLTGSGPVDRRWNDLTERSEGANNGCFRRVQHLFFRTPNSPRARRTRARVVLHTDGATLVFNGYTHEEFVELFHQESP